MYEQCTQNARRGCIKNTKKTICHRKKKKNVFSVFLFVDNDVYVSISAISRSHKQTHYINTIIYLDAALSSLQLVCALSKFFTWKLTTRLRTTKLVIYLKIDISFSHKLIMEVPNDFYVGRYQLSRFGNTDTHITWLQIFNIMIIVIGVTGKKPKGGNIIYLLLSKPWHPSPSPVKTYFYCMYFIHYIKLFDFT
jgi:hypothetical protein